MTDNKKSWEEIKKERYNSEEWLTTHGKRYVIIYAIFAVVACSITYTLLQIGAFESEFVSVMWGLVPVLSVILPTAYFGVACEYERKKAAIWFAISMVLSYATAYACCCMIAQM